MPEDGSEPSNYLIPKGKHINFNQGEKIKKGEYFLMDNLCLEFLEF